VAWASIAVVHAVNPKIVAAAIVTVRDWCIAMSLLLDLLTSVSTKSRAATCHLASPHMPQFAPTK
jgi:hypothetical protein